MVNLNKSIIILTIALGLAYNLDGRDVMSLKDCMQYAVENSVKVKIRQMDVDDARVERRDAILRVFTPEVTAGTSAYLNFGRSVDPETNTYVSTTSFSNGYQIGAGVTLFDGFSAVNNMKISKTALRMEGRQESPGRRQREENLTLIDILSFTSVMLRTTQRVIIIFMLQMKTK